MAALAPLMAKDTVPTSEDWLLSLTQLPGDDPAVRMRLLRTLEGLGAAVIRDGAYLLPDTPPNRRALEKLSEYIVRNAGIAHVIYAHGGTGAQDEQFRRLFDRSARYDHLVKVIESLKVSYGISDPGAISRVLHKQRLEFDTISALDFFPSEARERARHALANAQAEIRKLMFPSRSGAGLAPGEKLLGRTWATRRPLWADRLASAWFEGERYGDDFLEIVAPFRLRDRVGTTVEIEREA